MKEWKTPFVIEKFPSVWMTCEGQPDTTSIFVGFPAKWQVKFERVVGLKVCDESYDNNRRFWVEGSENNFSSYVWEDSPWLKDFNADYAEVMEDLKVIHYVLLGGDYNIEVLAHGNVDITPVVAQESP